MNNGGYFAIEGFTYQINQTVLAYLKNMDNPEFSVKLEGKQDMEIEGVLIQVKYRNGKYYPSRIKKAVQDLYKTYNPNKDQGACVLCYFSDKDSGVERYSVEELVAQFKIDDSNMEKLKMFSDVFYVKFAMGINETDEEITDKIKEVFLRQTRNLFG